VTAQFRRFPDRVRPCSLDLQHHRAATTHDAMSLLLFGFTAPMTLKSAGSFSFSAANGASKPNSGAIDLLYRVRGRSTSATPSTASSLGKVPAAEPASGEVWKNDAQTGKPPLSMEKELELSRRAIEKQQKLQSWLVEKERRELLKLQQEQQFIEEQRRQAAEKDAKYFRHAAATKRKLVMAATSSDSPKSTV